MFLSSTKTTDVIDFIGLSFSINWTMTYNSIRDKSFI